MKEYIVALEQEFSSIENGFKTEESRALQDFQSHDFAYSRALAFEAYQSPVYQVRMYGVFLFGYLSEDEEILHFMKEEVTKDENWRVQEILAKSFDMYCKKIGMKKPFPRFRNGLQSPEPNARRAVTEGLRIWTSRAYFKDHPEEAIRRLAALKADSSEYVRKSWAMLYEISVRNFRISFVKN